MKPHPVTILDPVTKATPPPLPSIIGERRVRRKWPSDDDDGNTQAFAA